MSTSMACLDPREELYSSEFEYRPVPPLVPVSAAFVLLSLSAFAWDMLLIVPLIGSVLAFLGWRQVSRSAGAYSGGLMAAACALLLPMMTASAAGLHLYFYATEVPEGFQRVSFATDIADKGFLTDRGEMGIHPDVEALADQPVFLKGYMYPTRDTLNLSSFVLCKDSGDCCFGGQPKMTDMVYVEMEPGRTVDYRAGLVSVAGVFRTTPSLDPTGLNPVYKLDGQYFSGAKTSY